MLAAMASLRALTARAMARAMLAGPPTERGLAARLAGCLGRRSGWTQALAERAARWPAERWWHWSPRTLGRWIEQHRPGTVFDLQRRAEEVPVAEYLALACRT